MQARRIGTSLASILVGSTLALAQAPTPTPVTSNVAVSAFAQTRGQDLLGNPCTTRGATGCGGCYPHSLLTGNALTDLLGQLSDVNPEWQPIAPMISGLDASSPPEAAPAVVTGWIRLSKSPGDDFSASHVSADYNAEIIPDNNAQFATGNTDGKVEFEWEHQKLPMFAWSGEGDRIVAVGRWIFDCGHPDPINEGTCSNNPAKSCYASSDCASCASGHCSNNSGQSCQADQECATCNGVDFAFQAEMHPPQAVAVIRHKALKIGHAVPAAQADVYISNDAGGAGDRCTVTHLANPLAQLSSAKKCFLHHCSITTDRNCTADKDCNKGETCLDYDPTQRLAKIDAPNFNHCSTTPKACIGSADCPSGETCVQMANFEFDLPLPNPVLAPGVTNPTLKIKYTPRKPKGAVMPKPIYTVPTPGPDALLHVLIPMTTPVSGKAPNAFAGTISAGWQEDITVLKHVKVKLLSLTINNPVKDATPTLTRQCTLPAGGLSGDPCTTNKDCAASVGAGSCSLSNSKACQVDADCPKKEWCQGGSECVGGIIPGWDLWAEVNGDWIKFAKLDTLGAQKPFDTPPYVKPSPAPFAIKKAYTFDEYLPVDGSLHIKASGHSLNCLAILFGHDLFEGLNRYGLGAGAACLGATSKGVGMVDETYDGPAFGTDTPGKPKTFSVTSTGGEGGACSVTTSRLCASDADCPAGACSNDASKACHVNADCGTGNTCTGVPETCNGRCSNNAAVSCHVDGDCGPGNECEFGGAFTLQYSIQVN